jgi:two-component system, OmpR family, heavy metal sensor histidine kinase CusS
VKPLPLRTSLTLVYTGMLALLVTALAIGEHSLLVRRLDDDVSANLEEKARGLHGYLRFVDGSPVLRYDPDDADSAAFVDDATDYYQVYDAQTGRLLTQSPGFESLGLDYTPDEVAAFRDHPGLTDVRTDRGRLRLSSTVISPTPGEMYLVQVGDLLDDVDRTIAGFDGLLLWRILVGLGFAAILGRWLAGRALAPLSNLAVATSGIDITNLHARLAVRGANDELDHVAHAFNNALARVEHSVGEMRQFSAALAHELRTPLAILRGEAELALRPSSSDEQRRQALTRQIDECDRLTRLINQILTLARAEGGEIRIANDPVDLAALAASVTEQIELVAAERGIVLTCQGADHVFVAGDAGWLERLLLILLDNAIKFTPAGGRIWVTFSCENRVARVAVIDSGPGIPRDALPHLFERFYRADPSRSRPTQGAGLGLALAKWIADRHGGTIDVQSQAGDGSTFTLSLAAMRRHTTRQPRGPRAAIALAESGQSRGADCVP